MKYLDWIAVTSILLGVAMLVADIGASGLSIAVIAVGIAVVAVDLNRRRSVHQQI
jgi:hypothetical protein